MMRKRDSQRKRVYRAEWMLRDGLGTRAKGANQWEWPVLVRLAERSWEQQNGGYVMPLLRLNTRRHRMSVYYPTLHTIELARTMFCPIVMLHELTHAELAVATFRGEIASHGPVFVQQLTKRIEKAMGFEMAQAYRKCLTANRVRAHGHG